MSVENKAPATATYVQETTHAKIPQFKHPLDPLTPDEIVQVGLAVRQYIAAKTDIKAIRFITSYLLPPPKKTVLAYLGIPLNPGEKPESAPQIVRKAEVDFCDVVTGDSYSTVLSLKDGQWEVDTVEQLPEGVQPQITVEELLLCEKIIREDTKVQKLAADVGITPEQLHADGWAIGYDDRFPKKARIQQALLFARFSKHDNLYAHPMDFIPVVDSLAQKVIHVDFPPRYYAQSSPSNSLYKDYGVESALSTQSTAPPPLDADELKAAQRARLPPPREAWDFLPDLIAQKPGADFKVRDDVKPLHVVQPGGVSFKMDGHVLEWQKWKMHIAFHHREGIAISTITYNDDGEIRPIFYRLSLAEMVVPYGAPEHPHPRKHAFDAGECGMGTMANELSLGCDCLGQIHYLPGAYTAHDGSAVVIKNVICIHEEDAGLLWKHTDFRVGGRSHAVRSRRLVVSMICTLANYEYIWNWFFYQDGNIEMEVRLTGILQVYVKAEDEPTPFGTTLAPGILAHYHQHIFSVRVDPMVDGLHNSVVETDIVSLPQDARSNHAGNAFLTQSTTIAKAHDGGRDLNPDGDRRWAIVNPKRRHPYSGKLAGYTITGMRGASVPLKTREGGVVDTRAPFAKRPLWVVKDVETEKGGRMWPSGKYMPQTRETPQDSIAGWVQGDDNLEEEDILVFLTTGITHIPRPEDWPVMPAEHVRVLFRPTNFFTSNPSMDVPGANDSRSVAAFSQEGGACCAH